MISELQNHPLFAHRNKIFNIDSPALQNPLSTQATVRPLPPIPKESLKSKIKRFTFGLPRDALRSTATKVSRIIKKLPWTIIGYTTSFGTTGVIVVELAPTFPLVALGITVFGTLSAVFLGYKAYKSYMDDIPPPVPPRDDLPLPRHQNNPIQNSKIFLNCDTQVNIARVIGNAMNNIKLNQIEEDEKDYETSSGYFTDADWEV